MKKIDWVHGDHDIDSRRPEQLTVKPEYLSRLIQAASISSEITNAWSGLKIADQEPSHESWLSKLIIYKKIRSLFVSDETKKQVEPEGKLTKIKEILSSIVSDKNEDKPFKIAESLLSATSIRDYNQKVMEIAQTLQSVIIIKNETTFTRFITELASVYLLVACTRDPSIQLHKNWFTHVSIESLNELKNGKELGIYKFIENVSSIKQQIVSLSDFINNGGTGFFFIIELGTWALINSGEKNVSCVLKGKKVSLPAFSGLSGLPETTLSGRSGYTTWVNKLSTLSKISSNRETIFENHPSAHVMKRSKSILSLFDILLSGKVGKSGKLWVQQLEFPNKQKWNAVFKGIFSISEEELISRLREYHEDQKYSNVPYTYLRSDGVDFHEGGLMGTYMPRASYINPYDCQPIFFLDLSDNEIAEHIQKVPNDAKTIEHRKTYIMQDVTLSDKRLKYVWVTDELKKIILEYFHTIGPEQTALVLGDRNPSDLFVSSGFDIHN